MGERSKKMKKGFIFAILSSIIAFIFLITMPKIEAAWDFDVFSMLDILSPNETPNFKIIENNTTLEINNPDNIQSIIAAQKFFCDVFWVIPVLVLEIPNNHPVLLNRKEPVQKFEEVQTLFQEGLHDLDVEIAPKQPGCDQIDSRVIVVPKSNMDETSLAEF